MEFSIEAIHARQIFDSRGWPTVEVDVRLRGGALGRAAVPSGASTGRHEAVELRDGDPTRFGGRGVTRALAAVNDVIQPVLLGGDARKQNEIDAQLLDLDGTADRSRLGANALLGVSLGVARAAAAQAGIPLWQYLGGGEDPVLPLPMVNIISGGLHAGGNIDLQDFLVMPAGAGSFAQAMETCVDVYHAMHDVLEARGLSALKADEGGFGPLIESNRQALDLLLLAVEQAGYRPGEDVVFAIDVAASHFFDDGSYRLASEGRVLSADGLIELLAEWTDAYPIASIEDGLAEDDWEGWKNLTARLGDRVQLVGDDLFTTNPERLRRGISEGVANAILVKMNQIGTVSETLQVIQEACAAGYRTVVSARSGETEDASMADLAVGTGAGQIKIGSVAQSERLAKYNQLLRIEEELGDRAVFAGGRELSAISDQLAVS
jgi:enolase